MYADGHIAEVSGVRNVYMLTGISQRYPEVEKYIC